jgi:hypothetical protein
MDTNFEYYYNNVPNKGQCRNNLIYTSLISKNKTIFCQWYYNDKIYHGEHNQVVDPSLMDEKFKREIKFLKLMSKEYPQHVPKFSINEQERKVYLEIDGPDMWELAGCQGTDYSQVVPDWQDQIIEILKAHKSLGIHKYSMHPSSFFVVDGKLKSINYFFTYSKTEPYESLSTVESHIYSTRQDEMRKHLESLGIEWSKPQPWNVMDKLCWNSFRTNYTKEFIERVLQTL